MQSKRASELTGSEARLLCTALTILLKIAKYSLFFVEFGKLFY